MHSQNNHQLNLRACDEGGQHITQASWGPITAQIGTDKQNYFTDQNWNLLKIGLAMILIALMVLGEIVSRYELNFNQIIL